MFASVTKGAMYRIIQAGSGIMLSFYSARVMVRRSRSILSSCSFLLLFIFNSVKAI